MRRSPPTSACVDHHRKSAGQRAGLRAGSSAPSGAGQCKLRMMLWLPLRCICAKGAAGALLNSTHGRGAAGQADRRPLTVAPGSQSRVAKT